MNAPSRVKRSLNKVPTCSFQHHDERRVERRSVLDMPNTFDTAAASSVAHWALVLVEPSLPDLSCLGGPRFCSAMMDYLAETAS